MQKLFFLCNYQVIVIYRLFHIQETQNIKENTENVLSDVVHNSHLCIWMKYNYLRIHVSSNLLK